LLEAIRQLVGERASLVAVRGLEVRRGDLHSEVALAVLALADVAEESEE